VFVRNLFCALVSCQVIIRTDPSAPRAERKGRLNATVVAAKFRAVSLVADGRFGIYTRTDQRAYQHELNQR
jgi:hypothetical protein